jgi:hypothetical protein
VPFAWVARSLSVAFVILQLSSVFSLCVPAFATGADEHSCVDAILASCEALYRKQYRAPNGYVCDHCFFNAGELGRRFEAEGASRDQLYVWVFGYPNSLGGLNQQTLTVAHVRRKVRWKYHAALEYAGRMFDFDHKDDDVLRTEDFRRLRFPRVIARVVRIRGRSTYVTSERKSVPAYRVPWVEYQQRYPSPPDAREVAIADLSWIARFATSD